MKVILDTDIGNDIDDALALSYLLRQPECELIGIVTSCGCAQTHAKIASAVCCAAGRKDVRAGVSGGTAYLCKVRPGLCERPLPGGKNVLRKNR